MKTLKIGCRRDLFFETEITVTHAALNPDIIISNMDDGKTIRELERELVIRSKSILRKYVTVFKKSKGNFASPEERKMVDQLDTLLLYLKRTMRLKTAQDAILPQIPAAKMLIPFKKSRFYPSQCLKLEFLEAVVLFDLDQAKNTIQANLQNLV
ncbi:MAG: hypothetical protein F6K19_41520 [Cyanothece sp. SIO1E1]|nr:hypothetical protein [Cyanothece sp. SIO1E1]